MESIYIPHFTRGQKIRLLGSFLSSAKPQLLAKVAASGGGGGGCEASQRPSVVGTFPAAIGRGG